MTPRENGERNDGNLVAVAQRNQSRRRGRPRPLGWVLPFHPASSSSAAPPGPLRLCDVVSVVALFICGSAGCGEPTPIEDAELTVRVTAGTDVVELGRAFPVTVVRTWRKGLEPEPWRDELLAPLVLRLESEARREDARHVEETRRYRAYAFAAGETPVPAATVVARGGPGEAPVTASGEPLVLRVRPSLDPSAPGAAELPGDPLPLPVPWRTWAVAAAALLAGAAIAQRARRRRAPEAPAPAPSAAAPEEGPAPAALRAIEALRAREPRDQAESDAWHVDAAAVVRTYASARFGVHARESTSEELTSAVARATTGEPSAPLRDVLSACDAVKFGLGATTTAERARVLDRAAEFVRGTAERSG